MYAKGLKVRWIYGACYEVVLPDGKHLIIDPFITPVVDKEVFSVEKDIERVDFILVTHTHGDHITDVQYLADKFGATVLLPAVSALEFMKETDMDFGRAYPVSPGDTMTFDGLRVDVSLSKHTTSNGRDSRISARKEMMKNSIYQKMPKMPKYSEDLGNYGSLDQMDYYFTVCNNIRLFFASGDYKLRNNMVIADEKAPAVVFRQVRYGQEPEEFGEVIASYHAQVAFPFHHENLTTQLDYDNAEYIRRSNARLQEINPGCRLELLDQFKWYDVALTAEIED